MTISLLNASLIAFTALIAVPVLAHLFARAKPREFLFPSLQWLHQIERQTTRLRKPKDWLLLALRTLAVAALIAAFLQPLLFSGTRLTSANSRKTLVLVIDRSASMAFVEQGRSRFARALSQADDILQSVGSQTLANIVWLDADPDAEFPEPAINIDSLLQTLRRANLALEPTLVSGAICVALEQLGRGEGAKELHLISDFQSTAWKDIPLGIPPNVTLLTHPVATTEAANIAISGLVVQPERPVTGTECRVLCRVRNFSAAEPKTSVQLAFGEVRLNRPVSLAPWSESVVEFRAPCGAAGIQSLSATLPEDAFPSDDRRFATIEIRESWRAAIEGPAQDASLLIWQRALAALGWIDFKSVTTEPEIRLAIRAAPDRAADLRAAAERGATVICQPGEDWSGVPWSVFWGSSEPQSTLRTVQINPNQDQPWTLQAVQEDHPLWQVFRSGEYGDPASGQFWKRLDLQTDNSQNLIRYMDGIPALAAQRVGKGWLILWNIELDEASSNRAQQPSFLVLLGELLLHHGETGGLTSARHFTPPQTLYWQPSQPVAVDQVRLQDESGLDQPLHLDDTQTTALFAPQQSLPPGNYKWLIDGQLAERASLNFPADAESDLRTLDPATLGVGTSMTLGTAAALAAQRDGLPLWPWCIGLTFLALILESFVAHSAIRRPATA